MEMENFSNVEIPRAQNYISKGESTLAQDNLKSMFNETSGEESQPASA